MQLVPLWRQHVPDVESHAKEQHWLVCVHNARGGRHVQKCAEASQSPLQQSWLALQELPLRPQPGPSQRQKPLNVSR